MALRRYYELLSSITRVVISTVLSRGLYHEQTLFQIRNLLREYRPNIVGTFKRYAGIGGSVPASTREALAPLVKSYTALLSLVDFINVSSHLSADFVRRTKEDSLRKRNRGKSSRLRHSHRGIKATIYSWTRSSQDLMVHGKAMIGRYPFVARLLHQVQKIRTTGES